MCAVSKHGALSAGAQLFTANVLRLGLGLLGNVLSATALGAVGMGHFSLVMATVGICGTVADAGLTYGLVHALAREREARPDYAHNLARTYFALRFLAGSLASVLGVLLALPLATYVLGDASLGGLLAFAFLTLFSLGISSYPGAVLQALDQFGRLSVATLLNAVITSGGIALLWASGNLTLESLLAWNVALPLLSALPAWSLLPRGWLPWSRGDAGDWRAAAREIWGFGRWVIVAVIGSMVLGQLDLILVGRLLGPAEAGVYAVALGLATRLDVVNQTMLVVLLPRASRLVGADQISTYVRQVVAAGALLALLFVPLALLAEPIITLLYGGEFAPAIVPFRLLLIVTALDLLVGSLLLLVFPLNRPQTLAAAEWLRVAVLLVAGWFLIPLAGTAGAAIGKIAARLVGAAYALPGLTGGQEAEGRGQKAEDVTKS